MLQFLGSQKVGYDLATKQQQSFFFNNNLHLLVPRTSQAFHICNPFNLRIVRKKPRQQTYQVTPVNTWNGRDQNSTVRNHGLDIRIQPLTTSPPLSTKLFCLSLAMMNQESRADTSILPNMHYLTLSINYDKFRMLKTKSAKGDFFFLISKVYNPRNAF